MIARIIPILALLVTGCGTFHHFVPSTPPGPGKAVGTITAGWSLNRFAFAGAEGNLYIGIGSTDAIGFGAYDFLLPGSVSFAHYQRLPGSDSSHLIYQFHTVFGGVNPRYEVDLAYAWHNGEVEQSVKVGLGYLGHRLSLLAPREGTYPAPYFAGVAGYTFSYQAVTASIVTYPWLTRSMAAGIRSAIEKKRRLGPALSQWPLRIERERVVNIDSTINSTGEHSYRITLSDSVRLFIREQRWGECIVCDGPLRLPFAYGPSPQHRPYAVYSYDPGRRDYPYESLVGQDQLDMGAIIRRFVEGGDLLIEEDPDIGERTLDRIVPGLDDLGFSIGYRTQ